MVEDDEEEFIREGVDCHGCHFEGDIRQRLATNWVSVVALLGLVIENYKEGTGSSAGCYTLGAVNQQSQRPMCSRYGLVRAVNWFMTFVLHTDIAPSSN